MNAEPRIETRAEQPYVAVRARASMTELGGLGLRISEVFAWLGAQGLAPAGAPFFRYTVIDMTRELEIDVGVPSAGAVAADGDVVSGTLPAGRYATLTHVGPPGELVAATQELLDWAAQQGLRWDMTVDERGEHWGSRLEIYLTDPGQEPDLSKWETQLAFRLAD